MSVWELYTQLFTRNWRCGRFAWSLSQRYSEKIRKKDVVMTAGRLLSWSIQIPQFLMFWWPAMKAGSTAMTQRPGDRFPVEACRLSQTQEGQTEQIHPQTFDDLFFFYSTGMIYMHWVPTGKTVNKEYYVEVLGNSGRDSVGRGQHSSNRISDISTRTMHQSTTPSLSQTIWPRWTSRQFLTLPIVQTLLPVTFGYSLNSRKKIEAVVMRQFRRWKRLWRRSLTCSQKRTAMGPSRSCWNGTAMHCNRRRLLRRGLEFHVCTINKRAHTKKVWKLI